MRNRAVAGALFIALLSFPSLPAAANNAPPASTSPAADVPSYKEIPYYLRKLRETDQEGRRIEYNKKIHDAIVNADLANGGVVKRMEPILAQVREAVDAGLDRLNLTGQAGWLSSALGYFEREKNRRILESPETDWMGEQTAADNGLSISVYPDRIQLHEKGKPSRNIVSGSNIHEGVISPNGKWVAYFTVPDAGFMKSEIWVHDIRRNRSRKVAVAPSCFTLLFSLDGGDVFFQEAIERGMKESAIRRVSVGGGKVSEVTKGNLLSTVVKKGSRKGDLVIYKVTRHPLGVTELSCPYLVDPRSGKEIGRIKNVACR